MNAVELQTSVICSQHFFHLSFSLRNQEVDESLGRVPLFPDEKGIMSPSKVLAELQRRKSDKENEATKHPLDFRNSVGFLPKWAKSKVQFITETGP